MVVKITRKPIIFKPDAKRVIPRFFLPGDVPRAKLIIDMILTLSEEETGNLLDLVLKTFSRRHRNITQIFQKHFHQLPWERIEKNPDDFTPAQILLVGSYFTMEFSIESSAFFNPSIVEDPSQHHLEKGQKRVIVSFRATGEGHISSIGFRSGIIDAKNNFSFASPSPLVDVPEHTKRHEYDKKDFTQKLEDINIEKDVIQMVMKDLNEKFIYGELKASIESCINNKNITSPKKEVIKTITWLAESHYSIDFSLDTALSERIIYPTSYTESNGIEDARFVRFTYDNGDVIYYAPYTAYDGIRLVPKLIETENFYHFKITPLHGKYTKDKGLALFPRKIKGKYAMLSRLNGSSNFIMFSDKLHLWQSMKKIADPKYPWEFVQIGNCGSPLETEHGWLLITHGVGPVRTYSLGAVLLDLDDPTKIIGRLKKPLFYANDKEREGYVPNVVYSCGSMIHNGELIIPYGMSDYSSSIITINMSELMEELLQGT